MATSDPQDPSPQPDTQTEGLPAAATAEPAHARSMLVVLTAVAGFIDAAVIVHVIGVFSANQSGNVVLVAMGVGEWDLPRAGGPLLALVCFACGVAIARLVLAAQLTRTGAHRPAVLLALEALLLALLAAGALAWVPEGRVDDETQAHLLLAVAALAMGAQTPALHRVAGNLVSTTSTASALAALSEEAVTRVVTPVALRHALDATLRLTALGVGCYAAGAIAATALRGLGPVTFEVPVVALLVAAVLLRHVRVAAPAPRRPDQRS